MGEVLRVDPDELRMIAERLEMHAADLRAAHASAHGEMAAAVTSFGATSSAKALAERISRWERETAEHNAELLRHGDGHRFAGTRYVNTDAHSSDRIASAGGGVDGPVSSIDL